MLLSVNERTNSRTGFWQGLLPNDPTKPTLVKQTLCRRFLRSGVGPITAQVGPGQFKLAAYLPVRANPVHREPDEGEIRPQHAAAGAYDRSSPLPDARSLRSPVQRYIRRRTTSQSSLGSDGGRPKSVAWPPVIELTPPSIGSPPWRGLNQRTENLPVA